jgi:glycosyltransferase involved in cell wall biosynthesis
MSLAISVITCTYNSIKYLGKSIESVLSQDYPNIEYIFVDGGSVDGTIDLIHEVPRPVKFVTGIRGGISAAMNKGIEKATGDVVAHLHSDDFYLHGHVLASVANILEESGAEWCFGRAMNCIDGECRPEQWKVPDYSFKRLLKGNFIPHSSTFVRKRVFNQLGLYNPEYRYAMDYDMWLRIGKLFNPVQIDEHWSVFRYHEGSLSSANQVETFKEDFAVRLQHVAKNNMYEYAVHLVYYLFRRIRLMHKMSAQGGWS